jgi:hypothetical protein
VRISYTNIPWDLIGRKIINNEKGEIRYEPTRTMRKVVMLLILRNTLRKAMRIREDSETDNSQ